VYPYLLSGCKIALGIAWKSGVAAEVIAVAGNSIGEKLYLSKIYLDTAGLFAWTIVIIALNRLFEWVFLRFLRWLNRDLQKEENGK
jgi:NitT/TauT family transport system permease protein